MWSWRKIVSDGLTHAKAANAVAHAAAVTTPRSGHEMAIVKVWTGLMEMAEIHQRRYGSGIGDDGLLGPAWASVATNLRTLLNGESGRLDCGTIDSAIIEVATLAGFDTSEW